MANHLANDGSRANRGKDLTFASWWKEQLLEDLGPDMDGFLVVVTSLSYRAYFP